MKFTKLILTLVLIAQSADSHALMALRRCDTLGDSLDIPSAQGRTAWARKCYPHEQSALSGNELVTIIKENGEVVGGYPIFGTLDKDFRITFVWKDAPKTANADCSEASKYRLIGACVASCFAPDQFVEFAEGRLELARTEDEQWRGRGPQGVRTVYPVDFSTDHATLLTKITPLRQIVTDVIDGTHSMVDVKLASGSIKMTINHPIVKSDGSLVRADQLRVGDGLVKSNGLYDRIEEITPYQHFGKVYNVAVDSNEPEDHIIFGQGYLSGSLWHQNQGASSLNRKLLRASTILEDLLANN